MDADKNLIERNSETTETRKYRARTSLDLTFSDLSYTVGEGKNCKQILHEICGVFKSGQLSAILGPSGAGKSSLMNILAGLKKSGILGRVEVNGTERDFKTFRKQAAYITQQDYLLSDLTVDEYMTVAAHLKLGNKVSVKEKKSTIEQILKTLGLTRAQQTRVKCLSGGERKRLSIALELIDNPAILFLDEPTSGLDSSSSLQCIDLLRNIALSGRTVIATIHQPSSRLLDYFHHLYIVTSGSCMYQGPVESLVPYLQSLNLKCPNYYNPADFAIDVASGEFGDVLPKLISEIGNGRRVFREYPSSSPASTAAFFSHDSTFCNDKNDNFSREEGRQAETGDGIQQRFMGTAPFHTQVTILLLRALKTMWREKILTRMRFILHVFVAILMGLLYWQVGDDAAFIFNNAGMIFFSQIFILYAAVMPTILTFTLERKVLVREHLNHWYNLKAYYLAKTLADIPSQIILPLVYMVIVYFMTGQPIDFERFSMLSVITIWISLIGQGFGLFFGAVFSIDVATFIAPIATIPFLLLSGFFVHLNHIPSYLSWLTYFSVLRYGFEGSMLSVYDNNRTSLACSDSFCHFRYPQKFLQYFGFAQSSYYFNVVGLLIMFLLIRVAGYFALRYKLRHVR
ncbi:ATP-binding cassette subfamily G member 4-like isoform X2 [Daphnia pulex]|uniref:ATP-binding cassette subfamily G member 4-like isoform X2 n=1 Tax=Daphnia pulex TaxID=6669 RepID=UPI001EDED280|nr:ATP-binding cassette subfamily G member 4-like isoform X2 [Daphnia pulex]